MHDTHDAAASLSAPMVSTQQPKPMTLLDALQLFRADLARRAALREEPLTAWSVACALTRPGVLSVALLRFGNWLHGRGWRVACRVVERLLFVVARSELQIGSRIGPGLVLPDEGTVGISSHARIGANATFFGQANIIVEGLVDSQHEFSIADHCVFGRRAKVYGTVSLAEGTQVKDNSVVLTSISTPGAVVAGIPARRRSQVPVELVRQWNPLRGRPLRPSGHDATECASPAR